MMKECMKQIGQSMSFHRTLMDYSNQFYFPALKNYRRFSKDNYAEAKSLAAYFAKLQQSWGSLKITKIESNAKPVMQRGDTLTVTAYLELGSISPQELQVELYHGSLSNQTSEITDAKKTEMKWLKSEGNLNLFQVRIECVDTGMQGHTVRILPKHDALVHPFRCGFIKWA
jgi:starch phosphorylase